MGPSVQNGRNPHAAPHGHAGGGTAYKKAAGTKPTASQFNGRVDWIRTSDPRVPNAVLYQTEPQPDAREKFSTLRA